MTFDQKTRWSPRNRVMTDRGRRQRRNNELRETVIRLREKGFSHSEIAEQLGITKNQAIAKARSALVQTGLEDT